MLLFLGTILGNFNLPLFFFSLQDTNQFYKEFPTSAYLHLLLSFALSIFFQNLGSILNISMCARGTRRGSGNISIDSNDLSTSSVLRLKKPRASFEGEGGFHCRNSSSECWCCSAPTDHSMIRSWVCATAVCQESSPSLLQLSAHQFYSWKKMHINNI